MTILPNEQPRGAERLALPARAIRSRLHLTIEPAAWAAYLPQPGSVYVPRSMPRMLQSQRHVVTRPIAQRTIEDTAKDMSPVAEEEAVSVALPQETTDVRVADIIGRVWDLARDQRGTRQVQRALETATNDDERAIVAAELRGHVWEAARCPHANHVIQKCIAVMRPQASKFIIDEFTSRNDGPGPSQVARHRYGCRILERLIEHCPGDQLQELMEGLVQEAVNLSKHPYGNFVMQHLLEHGQEAQRHLIATQLQQQAFSVASDSFARAVVSKALLYADAHDKVVLARAILQEPGLIASMARTRHGHTGAKLMLVILQGPDCEEAHRQLSEDVAALRSSRYGRFVAQDLQNHSLRVKSS